MRIKLPVSSIVLGLSLAWMPAPTVGAVQQPSVRHRRYYIRHRTKMQHTKIIGGTALKGASVGGLIGGPPGSAVGAVAGAAAGTAYDLKTRKVKTPPR
jgi:uncharacterized protein YcfJ